MINLFVLFFWGEDLRTNLPTWIYLVVYADVVAAAVLSGNRNFEGHVHPLTGANYLASFSGRLEQTQDLSLHIR